MKNKEITIYELMGLIKDDKAPKNIKYKGLNYEWRDNEYVSYDIDEDCLFPISNLLDLNNIVEIPLEENDEWEDIENVTLNGENIKWGSVEEYLDFPNDNEQKISSCIDGLGIAMNRLIKNQKYLKEKLEGKDENNK